MASDVVSCIWRIHINGKALSLKRRTCITSIDIEENCDGSDTCTIELQDPDYEFIEDNIFIEEATVKVALRLEGTSYIHTFSGYISAIDISFPESGYPCMSLFCLDNSHIMNREKKKRSWDNVTSADVVKKIAQEYGFKCVVESGYTFKTEDTISQSGETDIEFIEGLAGKEIDLFMCKLVGDTIYYTKKGLLSNSVAALAYRKKPYDVISFSPQINKETRQEKVNNSNISDSKTTEVGTADENTPRDTQGDSVSTSTASGSMKYDADKRTWEDTGTPNIPTEETANSAMTDFADSIDWEQFKE